MVHVTKYDAAGHKVVVPVRDEKEYRALRDSVQNLRLYADYLQTHSDDTKRRFTAFAYHLGDVPEGTPLRGCMSRGDKHMTDYDVPEALENDPAGRQQWAQQLAERILAHREEMGLLMLEGTANGGLHSVCRSQPGLTILENQVLNALLLGCEIDSGCHDIERIAFALPSSQLLYVHPDLFLPCTFSPEESMHRAQEMNLRRKMGQELLPADAHKKNKHYNPNIHFNS